MPDETIKGTIPERKYCPKCYAQYDNIDKCPDDGTELRGPKNDPLVGKVFAERYQIESVLGLGGMSIVYRAKHRLMDRLVAIKMLHSNIKNDHLSLERFRLEAQAASALSHQNIITVYDFGVTPGGEAFFVMDFLDGESLSDMLERKQRLPWERAISIFKQICDGLGAAHRKSIVHRDMKPANVVLIKQDDGTELVKLVDFGIAKLLPGSGKQSQQLTKTGEVFGSPIYMSPEQCMGKELDRRSDLYALGCLMYEVIAGDPPFLGSTFLETLNKHVGEDPKPFAEFVPDVKVPAELEQIIFKCMAKDPDKRFQNAEEIRDQLSFLTVSLSATAANRAAISQPMNITQAGKLTGLAALCPTTTWRWIAGITGALLVSLVGFAALWPGPDGDKGTPLSKMIWQIEEARGADAVERNDFAGAESSLNNAEALARSFGDTKLRLEKTLKTKADLYSKWEGHAQLLEAANNEVNAIQGQRLMEERKKVMASIDRWSKFKSDSAVAKTDAKLRAEAEVPSILTTSAKLFGRRLFIEQVELLKHGIEAERKLLGEDSPSVVKLETAMAEGYIALRRFPEVRPLLAHACKVHKANIDASPLDYVRALSRLGQFDLDQSNLKDAEQELAGALKLAKEKNADAEVQILCLRSYADMLRQTKREKESEQYIKEAEALESKASDLPKS